MQHLFSTDAPKFKQEKEHKEINLGGNVTFDCHAEGNPAPQVQWKYTSANNVMETTEGRQKTVTVTGATSTNAVVYICVATNKVGTVSRSVTLNIKGIIDREEQSWMFCFSTMKW